MIKKERIKKTIKELIKKTRKSEEDKALLSWQKKRAEFAERCRQGYSHKPGELINILEGLTPDGYNKKGKKVSFVEQGMTIFFQERIKFSGEVKKISNVENLKT